MKKIFLIMLLPLLCQSQIYRKMNLDTNYYWRMYKGLQYQMQGCGVTYQIKAVRYAVFNGKTYSLIRKFGSEQSGGNIGPPYPPECASGNIYRFVRQDTVLKKVWTYDSIQDQETLLYDFSQNIGDSAKHVLYIPSIPPQYAKVTGIDSVLLDDGYYHRRIIYTVMPSGTGRGWSKAIEGAGYTGGFFDTHWINAVNNPGVRYLRCHGKIVNFPDSTQTIYTDGTACGILLTGMPEYSNDFPLKIYPNPAAEQIILFSELPIKKLVVSNALGVVVWSKSIITENEIKIDVSAFPAGTYCLKLTEDNARPVFKKFVITR